MISKTQPVVFITSETARIWLATYALSLNAGMMTLTAWSSAGRYDSSSACVTIAVFAKGSCTGMSTRGEGVIASGARRWSTRAQQRETST
jgi:hypothetical protein